MKQHIKVWGSRTFVVVLLILAINHWGIPIYEQYFVPTEAVDYIPTGRVQEGEFLVSFHELGTLEAQRSVPVSSEISGKIISMVNDGTMIRAGDVVVVLDTTEIEREIHNQTLEYNNRLAEVDRVLAELELLREANRTDVEKALAKLEYDKNELEIAQEELEKRKRLAEEQLIPGTQVDQALGQVRARELAVRQGEADLELKRKEVESKEQQKLADVRNVRFRADMSDSRLREVEERLENTVILAPASGLVVKNRFRMGGENRTLQEGDNVNPRQTICTLPDLNKMLTKVQVGESDAPKVFIGMPALIRLDAVPGQVFTGSIVDISSLATEPLPWERTGTGKSFEVIIEINEKDPQTLKPGMTADVEFISLTLDNAVYVPLEAVVEREGKTYVFVKKDDDFVRTQVSVGIQNDNFVEIKAGVSPGQTIALRDPTRELDQQEAGTSLPDNDNNRRDPIPIPGIAD